MKQPMIEGSISAEEVRDVELAISASEYDLVRLWAAFQYCNPNHHGLHLAATAACVLPSIVDSAWPSAPFTGQQKAPITGACVAPSIPRSSRLTRGRVLPQPVPSGSAWPRVPATPRLDPCLKLSCRLHGPFLPP